MNPMNVTTGVAAVSRPAPKQLRAPKALNSLRHFLARFALSFGLWSLTLLIFLVPPPVDHPSAIAQLDSAASLREWISDRGVALIEFTNEFCYWCDRLQPSFSQAAAVLRDEYGGRVLGQVHASTGDPELLRRFRVEYFPALFLYKGGQWSKATALLDAESDWERIVKVYHGEVRAWRQGLRSSTPTDKDARKDEQEEEEEDPDPSVISPDARLCPEDVDPEDDPWAEPSRLTRMLRRLMGLGILWWRHPFVCFFGLSTCILWSLLFAFEPVVQIDGHGNVLDPSIFLLSRTSTPRSVATALVHSASNTPTKPRAPASSAASTPVKPSP